MKNRSPLVDKYIEASAPFSQPILKRFRRLFHKACPQIHESIKWSAPCFEHQGIVAGMAAFKKHVRVAFWKGELMRDEHALFATDAGCRQNSMKIGDVKDLPSDDILLQYVREAVALNEQALKSSSPKKVTRPKLVVPGYFLTALKRNKKARATFEKFSPSHQREYVQWVTEAKREATREKRLNTAIEWMAEGKPRNWKYMK